MLTLSVRQHWASLLVHGIQKIENRNWRTVPKHPPQWLAIHTGKSVSPTAGQFLREEYRIEEFHLGAVIGAVYWIGSYGAETLPRKWKRDEWFSPDNTAWLVFDGAVRINPVPCKGQLRFFTCPPVAEKRIQEEIKCGTF